MSSKLHTIDKSHFPIIVVTMGTEQPTLEEVNSLFDEIEEIFATSKGPMITITDNTYGVTWLDSKIRIAMGKRADQFNQKYYDRNLAAFLVLENIMAKMMLKAINLLVKNKETQIVVDTLDEAMTRAKEIMSKSQK